ncbi:Pyridoxal phosphate-dependent decarboxylase [Moelleriella libera RCEF 2490]|uniref:Pyridoxal phosphate-dependent decarboxylase n=1 Tax=Moelleriella libera RCEF 2490 TaxID=1081109 RepID=A0A168ELA6_9HYPO|nr:Pyridoxal phosphate-dependent decarboxylase [Moelleriella libera RCEF 2490]
MPASDHGSITDEQETSTASYPMSSSSNIIINGKPAKKALENGGATTPAAAPAAQTSLDRAHELEDLLDAVKALVVPFVRDADAEAAVKPLGRLADNTTTTGTTSSSPGGGSRRNVLAEPLSPQQLLQRYDFSLPAGQGRGREGLLRAVDELLRYSVNTWDQGYMDKLPATTNAVGVVSELVLGVLNTNNHVYHVSPALTVVEKVTSRMLAACFGFAGPHAGGVTCAGGSGSNLTSLVVARNALYPECKVVGARGHDFVIFTSEQSHYSVEKAAIICGMGAANVVSVPVDDYDPSSSSSSSSNGTMSVTALRRLVLAARDRGQTPLYVNATAGTTVHGRFDRIRAVAAVCRECGRRADSLKLALAWIYYGAAGLGRRVDHAFDMARRLADLVDASPDFTLISSNPPPCVQVCFYYTPRGRMLAGSAENSRVTRAMIAKMVHRGFMFDFAPGPDGDFFRVVLNCETLPGTVDGLFKGLSEVGEEVVPARVGRAE